MWYWQPLGRHHEVGASLRSSCFFPSGSENLSSAPSLRRLPIVLDLSLKENDCFTAEKTLEKITQLGNPFDNVGIYFHYRTR